MTTTATTTARPLAGQPKPNPFNNWTQDSRYSDLRKDLCVLPDRNATSKQPALRAGFKHHVKLLATFGENLREEMPLLMPAYWLILAGVIAQRVF